MKKEIKKYITYCITEGCSEQCNEAEMENSPPLKTMLFSKFIDEKTDDRISLTDLTIKTLQEAQKNEKIVRRLERKLDGMNQKGEMDLKWVHSVFTTVLKGK